VIIYMVYQLSCSKLINYFKLYSPWKRLPFEIVQFIKWIRFFPPFFSQLHTSSDNVAIVSSNYHILESFNTFVHKRILSSHSDCFIFLFYYFLTLFLCYFHFIYELFTRSGFRCILTRRCFDVYYFRRA